MSDQKTKCLKELENGDTMMNERIALIVENSVLLTEHHNTYNFPGGSIPFEYFNKPIGTTSLKELNEELGITFKTDPDIKLAGYYFDHKGCLRLLVFVKVDRTDIIFGKATHVWESKDFTLVPINLDIVKTNNIGKFLEDGIIQANDECATHITYNNETIDKITSDSSDSNISKDTDTYYIRLTEHPQLSTSELEILKMLNGKITGYIDTEYIYTDDYICKYKYIPFNEVRRITISNQFQRNNRYNNTFDVKVGYEDLLNYLYMNKINALIRPSETILTKNRSDKNLQNMYNKITTKTR